MIEPLSIHSPVSEPRFRLYQWTGNCLCFLVFRSGPWFSLGPDCPLCLCVLAIMCGFAGIFCTLMAPFAGAEMRILGTVVIASVIGFYLLTALKDAGIEPRAYRADTEQCSKCGAARSPDTFHCNICEVCIRKLDHHCPLTGKCIGEGNIRYFYSFLLSLFLFVCYGVLWGLVSTSPNLAD